MLYISANFAYIVLVILLSIMLRKIELLVGLVCVYFVWFLYNSSTAGPPFPKANSTTGLSKAKAKQGNKSKNY